MNHQGKNSRNHEYQDSNDSASTPESNTTTTYLSTRSVVML